MSKIEAKLDALMSKMSTWERRNHLANAVGIEEGNEYKCITDKGLSHEDPYLVEEALYVSGNRRYKFKPNNNLPIHYTPTLRNHGKFSYRSGV